MSLRRGEGRKARLVALAGRARDLARGVDMPASEAPIAPWRASVQRRPAAHRLLHCVEDRAQLGDSAAPSRSLRHVLQSTQRCWQRQDDQWHDKETLRRREWLLLLCEASSPSPLVYKRAQLAGRADRHAAIAGFDQSPRFQPLQNRPDRICARDWRRRRVRVGSAEPRLAFCLPEWESHYFLPRVRPRSALSAALFVRQILPSSRKRAKAGQRVSM
jgi:hypothetical protein